MRNVTTRANLLWKACPEMWHCVLSDLTVVVAHDALRSRVCSLKQQLFLEVIGEPFSRREQQLFCWRAGSFDSWASVTAMLSAALWPSDSSVLQLSRQHAHFAKLQQHIQDCQSSFLTCPTGIRRQRGRKRLHVPYVNISELSKRRKNTWCRWVYGTHKKLFRIFLSSLVEFFMLLLTFIYSSCSLYMNIILYFPSLHRILFIRILWRELSDLLKHHPSHVHVRIYTVQERRHASTFWFFFKLISLF